MDLRRVENLAVLLRVHRRHRWLPLILRQIQTLAACRRVHLLIHVDRPTPEVSRFLEDLKSLGELEAPNLRFTLLYADAPVQSGADTDWIAPLRRLLEMARRSGPVDAAMVWDDDWLLSDHLMDEILLALEHLQYDRYDADWIQCSNPEGTQYDAAFPRHRGCVLFRAYRDDDWRSTLTSRVVGGGAFCPHYVMRSDLACVLDGNVMHFGYCTDAERKKAWESAKASGQLCAFFRQLAAPPDLQPCVGRKQTSAYLAESRGAHA